MARFGKVLLTSALVAGASASLLAAQQPPRVQIQPEPQTNGGSVTGRVICSDTQRPARFANIMLIPVEQANGSGHDHNGIRLSGARTDLDGVFTATNVQPGDYYVTASATGYVPEAALIVAAGGDVESALAKLPEIHVGPGSSSTVNLSLERGSVISGRIQWDDGSPAAGVQVNAVNANAARGQNGRGRLFGFFSGFGGEFAQTDDRGQFRLTSLPRGDYLVRAIVQAPSPANGSERGFSGRTTTVMMYAPGTVRRADAQTITLRAGEERDDVTMVMDLASLHRVSGHVSATSGSVASGTVRLIDAEDPSLLRVAPISSDGSYTLTYVPAGNYSLSVPLASSNTLQQNPYHAGSDDRGGTTFQPFQEALSVTDSDLTDVDVTLTPVSQASK